MVAGPDALSGLELLDMEDVSNLIPGCKRCKRCSSAQRKSFKTDPGWREEEENVKNSGGFAAFLLAGV